MTRLPFIEKSTQWVKLKSGTKIRYSRMEFNWDDFDYEEDFDAKEDPVVFLCIPGNPGNDGFYQNFGIFLLRAFASSSAFKHIKFFSIAHANHVPLLPGEQVCDKRFSLDDQIKIKMEFMEEYLPIIVGNKKSRIFLIGHSIGAYISLKILPKLLSDGWNCVTCYCLFPTVEDMALTPNGTRLGPIVKFFNYFDSIFRWPFDLIHYCIPKSFKKWAVRKFLGDLMSDSIIEAAAELINPLVVRNIVHMTVHELQQVCTFDESLIATPHNHHAMFFYAREDGWAPVEFATRMTRRMPRGTLQVIVDPMGEFEHAFVLKNSLQMAQRLNRLILSRLGISVF